MNAKTGGTPRHSQAMYFMGDQEKDVAEGSIKKAMQCRSTAKPPVMIIVALEIKSRIKLLSDEAKDRSEGCLRPTYSPLVWDHQRASGDAKGPVCIILCIKKPWFDAICPESVARFRLNQEEFIDGEMNENVNCLSIIP